MSDQGCWGGWSGDASSSRSCDFTGATADKSFRDVVEKICCWHDANDDVVSDIMDAMGLLGAVVMMSERMEHIKVMSERTERFKMLARSDDNGNDAKVVDMLTELVCCAVSAIVHINRGCR